MTVLALPLKDGAGACRARRLPRRALGRDRDGDRRDGRGRDHDLEPSRRADRAAPPRLERGGGRQAAAGLRSRRLRARRAAGRDLRRHPPRLRLLPGGRRRRRSPRSASSPSRRWRRSPRPSSAGCSGRAARRSARAPGSPIGFAIWGYTLLLPSLALEGAFWTGFVKQGPVRARAAQADRAHGARAAAADAWRAVEPRASTSSPMSASRCCGRRTPSSGCRRRPSSATDDALGRAELPAFPGERQRRRSARDGRALSRRGAHQPLLRGLRARAAAARSRDARRPTSTSCAMPSTSSPR